jgi:hypothetical protein
LSVGTLFQNGSLHENNMTINETVGMTFGATTGDELRVRVSSAGQPNFVFATVTVESVGGADVRCTLS